ncbi:hypothetical protein KAR91_69630, partial [Candidatus Pacearchaeota archaeon]|nr:hypothetical protein [Candidatus Pacearchaeota archaeon]
QPPADKRMAEGGKIEEKWGEWDGTAVTTGDIDLECDNVLFFIAFDAEAVQAVQVELDTDGSGAQAGWVNLNFTSGSSGRFFAICQYN